MGVRWLQVALRKGADVVFDRNPGHVCAGGERRAGSARRCATMTPSDPWAFGLNHLLTLIGFAITASVAYAGFTTFEKWKRERIEERRIDIALEAMALAYEAAFVFDSIRSPMSFSIEWSEMKGVDDPSKRRAAGPYYAILRRIDQNKDYFDRIWKMQPRFMAVFGKDTADIFKQLHQARRNIEVSAEMLMEDVIRGVLDKDVNFRKELKADIWGGRKNDKIAPLIDAFVAGVEKHCQPVIAHRYATDRLVAAKRRQARVV